MKQQAIYYGISELSKHSSLPVSTIKFYLRKSLLPSPIKTSKTMALYTPGHLEKLKLIKKLQQEENRSLEGIKEILGEINEREAKKASVPIGKFLHSRGQGPIIEAAIKVFRTKGFSKTTIKDIASAAHISKGTFYSIFKNKKELFIKCFEKIFFDTHCKTWGKLPKSKIDPLERMRKRFQNFYREYPKWSDMMIFLRGAAITNPKDFKNKVDEIMLMTVDHASERIERGIQLGINRQVDTKLVGIMILGILDYFCYFLSRGKLKGSRTMLIKRVIDIIFNGIKNPKTPT